MHPSHIMAYRERPCVLALLYTAKVKGRWSPRQPVV